MHQFLNLSAFAEEMLIHENACVAIPKDMPFDKAAVLGCAVLTGFGAAVNTAGVKPGQTVAIKVPPYDPAAPISAEEEGPLMGSEASVAGKSATVLHFAAHIGSQPITGLLSVAPASRGYVLALHGGGYDASYWHPPVGDLSLIELGVACGFSVLAINRPGYRDSTAPTPEGLSLDQQADLLFDLIDEVAPERDRPVFLIGHSMGGILALKMAAHARSSRLSAVDVSGVPLRYPPEMQPIIDVSKNSVDVAMPDLGDELRRWMFYGADGSFDPQNAASVPGSNPVPRLEMTDAMHVPKVLPNLMEKIEIPIQWTIAGDEKTSVGGQDMLDLVRSRLRSSRYVRTESPPSKVVERYQSVALDALAQG